MTWDPITPKKNLYSKILINSVVPFQLNHWIWLDAIFILLIVYNTTENPNGI